MPLGPLLGILNVNRLLRAAKPEYVETVADGMLLGRSRDERAQEISELLEREGIGRVRWERGRLAVYPINPEARTFLWRVAKIAVESQA